MNEMRLKMNGTEDALRRSLDEIDSASRALVSALGEARRAMSMVTSLSGAVGLDRAAVVDAGAARISSASAAVAAVLG